MGGAVTAILWKLLAIAFAMIVEGSANYSAIYSAFATLIFFMIWLYAGWIVLLIGACISYYVQNPSNVLISRDKLFMSNEMRERLALSIIGRIGACYYTNDNTVITVDDLADMLKLPIRVVQRSVDMLKEQKILAQASEKPYGLFPSKPFDKLTIADLLIAIRSAETERGFIASRANTELKVMETMRDVEKAYQVQFGRKTIKSWILDAVKPKSRKKSKK